MTIAFWCVFLAALLHVVSKAPVIKAQLDTGNYDNNHPRTQQAGLKGWGQRALAAHQNELDAFPFFATGVLIAAITQVDQGTVDALAVVWVLSRLLYLWLYLADKASARSAVWGISYTISMALICSPAWAS